MIMASVRNTMSTIPRRMPTTMGDPTGGEEEMHTIMNTRMFYEQKWLHTAYVQMINESSS